jgi:hypothetical protein
VRGGLIPEIEAAQDDAGRRAFEAYDRNAASFAEDWEAQPSPDDIYDIVGRFFSNGPTADMLQALRASKILLDEQRVSISSGKTVRRIVARKV